MSGFPALFQLRTESGSPVQIGALMLIPQSRALVVRLPFAVFVWNRAVAVWVERDGQRARIPIADHTRILQLGTVGLGLLIALTSARSWRR